MNYRMIAYSTGRILVAVAATMTIPLALSLYYREGNVIAYLIPIIISIAIGAAVSIKTPKNKSFFVREGFIIVALAWIGISLIGALPFYISGQIPKFTDCFFETVSGFTTTGSSILLNVENMSKSLLFWRSFTHWLGGMGVLVFTMAIFTAKDTRTTHMMKAEMPGPIVGKLTSKWQFSARILYLMYIALTVIEIIFLLFGGMPLFDSVVHAFGTAGTGGFGIKNTSIAFYNSAYIDYVISIFMILFGMNFNIFYLMLIRKFTQIKDNEEIRWYLCIIAASALIIAFNILPLYKSFGESFRYAFFQVSSIMTTTGYSTADFAKWPMLSQMILVILMVIGGCAGSTGGGLKVVRVMILAKVMVRTIKNTASPRSVFSVKNDGKQLETGVVKGIMAYLVVYVIFAVISLIIVSLDNMDFTTTVTSVIATMNNIGPGLGAVGPTGNFAAFSPLSKIVLSVGMLAGRLEFYPILILFSPYTWKRS
ncbi:MAG: TrkH family potassium uptake protein [Oscillospiraceae bacterium]|nr:TrkH family potassium uptake protein [Oscillospiraceae bacterium]